MFRIARYTLLITFGAVLATSISVLLNIIDRREPPLAVKTARELPIERRVERAPVYPAERLTPIPATLGWQVDVFSQDGVLPDTRASKKNLLGSFLHTGNWIDLAEFRKHDGIYVAAPSSIKLRGYMYADTDDDVFFAVHFNNFAAKKVDQARTKLISCKVTMRLNNSVKVLDRNIKIDTRTARAELRADRSLKLDGGGWHYIEATFACQLPDFMNQSDIAVRICERRGRASSFAPVRPVMPLEKGRVSGVFSSRYEPQLPAVEGPTI